MCCGIIKKMVTIQQVSADGWKKLSSADYCRTAAKTIIPKEDMQMDKYVCDVCGYVYDPEVGDPDNGIAPGTAFEDLPDDWTCPLCGVGKDQFSAE